MILRLALAALLALNLAGAGSAHAAVVDGVSAGFVTTAPTDNPGGNVGGGGDGSQNAGKFVAPAGATKIIEFGCYKKAGTAERNWEMGLYTHDTAGGVDKPGTLIGASQTNASGTTYGLWLRSAAVDIAVTGGTTYWIAHQMDSHTGTTTIDASSTTWRRSGGGVASTLANPWNAASYEDDTYIPAFYALYEGSGGGSAAPVIMRHNRNRRMQ